MKMKITIDEINDQIREQVEREIPTPRNGFETTEQADEHRAKQDARFLKLCAANQRN